MTRRPPDPTSIGEYDLLARIGEGGAGVVYKARHRQSEAIVAIKVLHAHQGGNRTQFIRFEQEFRAARPLHHPHLVRVFDFQVAESGPFLVMEYVEGRSLGECLERSGRLPPVEAIRIVKQVALALDWLHDQNILHRDVKPDNIIVSPDGGVKLTDLGLVKELLLDRSLTRTGAALGTPNFMAPEQFRDAKRVDRRCDVYSLGATVYQMVTGEIPFRMSSPFDAWLKKSRNDFARPRELVPDLAVGLDWAISRAMSSDPELRPATCGEFVLDLIRALELSAGADSWELVFENAGGLSDPLRADTAGICQLLRGGYLRGDTVLARRPGAAFEPLAAIAEFRDALPAATRASPPAEPPLPTPDPPAARPPGDWPRALGPWAGLITFACLTIAIIKLLNR